MEFRIRVSETLSRTIKVDAESVQAAIDKADKMYKDEEIVLGYDDYDYHSVNRII